jgi:hypothetical protein
MMEKFFMFAGGVYLAWSMVSLILSAGLIARRIRRHWQAPKVYAFRGKPL